MSNIEVTKYRAILKLRKKQQQRRNALRQLFNLVKFALVSFWAFITIYSGSMFLINFAEFMRSF